MSALEKANKALLEGKAARFAGLTTKEAEAIRSLMLLTLKPVIYAANVADSDLATGNDMSRKLFAYAESHGSKAVLVSAQVRSARKHDFFLDVVYMLFARAVCWYCRWSQSCPVFPGRKETSSYPRSVSPTRTAASRYICVQYINSFYCI